MTKDIGSTMTEDIGTKSKEKEAHSISEQSEETLGTQEDEKSEPAVEMNANGTRFNFYTAQVAQEIHRQTSKDDAPKNRFNFYNAAEVGPIATPSHKRTSSLGSIVSTAPNTAATRSPSLPRKMEENTAEIDSNEILRSLQETERQHPRRMRRSSSAKAASVVRSAAPRQANSLHRRAQAKNPYEEAIKEALAMLQQQQNAEATVETRQSEQDVVMQMRRESEASPESQRAEQIHQQERIAKYASRLVKRTKPPLSPPTDENDAKLKEKKLQQEQWIPPTPGAAGNENAEELIRLRSASDDFSVGETPQSFQTQSLDPFLDHSVATSTSQEVQRGVEKVLLAILERANASTASVATQQVDTEQELDALAKAMDDLLQPSLSFETVSTVRSRRPNRRVSEQLALDELPSPSPSFAASPTKSSVVDELLDDQARESQESSAFDDEKLEEEEPDNHSSDNVTPSASYTELQVDEYQGSIEVVDSGDAFDDDEEEEESTSGSSEYETEEEDDDDVFEDSDESEDDPKDISVDESTLTHLLGKLRRASDADREEYEDDKNVLVDESTRTRVLGPLSHKSGGITGVVLEATSYEEGTNEENVPPPPPNDDASTPLSPPSLYETLSSAVKDAESFVSYMTSGGYPSLKDKYSTGDDDEPALMSRGTATGNDVDADAHELMRSLCAHLLPYGVDKSKESTKLERIPVWDESNPDEAGYRIIRLSKRQLRAVEREFEKMVKSVKLSSERDLNGTLSKMETPNVWNGVPDDDFARDLEEAEELLDQEEKRQEEADFVNVRSKPEESEDESSRSHSDSSESGTMETGQSPLLSDDDDTLLTSHPDFPGIKVTGKGEIGDFEYFHLPIIYKSNVTGFEPTKDLYLEPGNVVAGQYLVENELGSAAFSTAYRCVDLSSPTRMTEKGLEVQEEVCLKVIKNTKDFFDQSLDEIKILELLRQTGQCHEKNVLEMKKFFYHREHLIIVTELLRQNLFEFGKFITDSDEEPYFTRKRLCYITRQVLIALEFVHSMGLVHSDIKPENILLSSYSRARVKLIDFGSSCYLTDRQSSYIQSRSYRAPEVVLGLPYDGKIDIWSLGCVIAEMYTGEVTFQNDSIVSMLSRIEAICGPFPRHMIASGRQSARFFTKSGLLYEHVGGDVRAESPPVDAPTESNLLDVFQPKRTTLAARLGIPDIETEDEAHFVDFCSKLLAVDPDSRPTAAEALKHPWIVAGESITEEEIKYPSR